MTIAWIDNNGIPRSRTVPVSRVADVARRGVGVTTLFAVFDSHDGITFAHEGLSNPERVEHEADDSDGDDARRHEACDQIVAGLQDQQADPAVDEDMLAALLEPQAPVGGADGNLY